MRAAQRAPTGLAEGHRRHVAGARRSVELLAEADALAEGVDVDEATDALSVLSDVRYALLLQQDYGWSLDRIEGWMASTSRRLLLRPPA